MSLSFRTAGSALALLIGCGAAMPAYAQSANDTELRDELNAMRAQMAAMAERISQLEGELDQAETAVAAVAQQSEAAKTTSAQALAKAEESSGSDVSVEWKGAPKFTSKSGFSFKPRGRLNLDAGYVNAPESTGRDDGFGNEARRARLGVQGDIPGGFGYKFEVDFAGNDLTVTDAFLSYKDGGATITVGQHNTFQGLEELSSSLHTSFIERAAFTDAFGFERRMGVSAQYLTGDVLVQGGVFSDNMDDLSNKNWGSDGRIVYMPKWDSAQIHLGASVHYADVESGSTVRYRQRPTVHFTSERFINTDSFDASSEFGIGLESAVIAGPFHAAAEAYWQDVSRPGGLEDPTFFGGYVEAGYFLTGGDKRGYKKGVFGRVKPASPVGEGGWGALQFNVRYDYLDLTDGGIIGGSQDGYQMSLVWTPTDFTRLLLNYNILSYDDAFHAKADGDRSYTVDSFGVRAQIDF